MKFFRNLALVVIVAIGIAQATSLTDIVDNHKQLAYHLNEIDHTHLMSLDFWLQGLKQMTELLLKQPITPPKGSVEGYKTKHHREVATPRVMSL